MADARGFFKVTNGFPEHPKVEAAGGDAGWLWVCATAYCSRNLTDGMIPIGLVPRLSDRENPKQLASILLEVGLWHAAGHECKRCVQPDGRHYVIHDYLDHQTSAERARETSLKRAIAGQRGGQAKAAASKLLGGGYDGASSKSLAEEEVEEEVHRKDSSSSAGADDGSSDTSHRAKREPKPDPMARFPEFWKVYPKKVGRPAAEKNWAKAIRAGADPQAIIDGARLYALECRTKDKEHIKHPQGWLTDGRWMDERAPTLQLELGTPDAPPRPAWCGLCNERTRMTEDEDQPERCPRCHPRTQKETTP